MPSRRQRAFVAAAAFLGCGTLVFDFALGIAHYGGILGAVGNHLSYFTLWTNTLVAISLVMAARGRESFWTRPTTVTAIATSIFVVAAVYNGLLRATHETPGLYVVVNELTHIVMPALYLAYWWWIAPRATPNYRGLAAWVAYPLAYTAYTAVQGELTGFYPYPFADVGALGYPIVSRNIGVLLVVFVALSFGFAALKHRLRPAAD